MHNDNYDNDYLVSLIDPSTGPFIIKRFCDYIKRSRVEFDSVVCRGTSGLLVAPAVCHTLTKHLIISRKKDDGSHAMNKLEGFRLPEKFIIVDDLIASGSTIRAALLQMKEYRPGAVCVGIFLYRSSARSSTEFEYGGKYIPRFNQEVDKRFTADGTAADGFNFHYCPSI